MITKRRTLAAALMTALTVVTGLMTTAAAPVPLPPRDAGGNCIYRQTVDAKTAQAFDFTFHYEHPGGAVLMGHYRNGEQVRPNGTQINDRQRQLADGFIFETDLSNSGFWKISGTPTKPGTYRFDVYTGHQDYRCKEVQLTVNVTGKPVYDPSQEPATLVPKIPAGSGVDSSQMMPLGGNLSPAIRISPDGYYRAHHLNVCVNSNYDFSLHEGRVDPNGYKAFGKDGYAYAVGRTSVEVGDIVGLSRAGVGDDPHTCDRVIDWFIVTSSMLNTTTTPDSDHATTTPDNDHTEIIRIGGGDAPAGDTLSRLSPWGEMPPGLEF